MLDIAHHKAELEIRGITKITGLLSAKKSTVARNLISETASQHGLLTRSGWQKSKSRFKVDKSFRNALKALNSSAGFPSFIDDSCLRLTQALVGEPVQPLPPGQQILFSLPDADTWSVPHDVWHVDAPRLGAIGPPGLQMFTFLDDVEPGGGGTLVLAGSHRLLNTPHSLRSKDLKQALVQEDYFRWLFDAKRAPLSNLDETRGTASGVDLEVVELTGRTGDIYLMDLRALHTPAPNASDKARIMLTCRLPRKRAALALLDPSRLNSGG